MHNLKSGIMKLIPITCLVLLATLLSSLRFKETLADSDISPLIKTFASNATTTTGAPVSQQQQQQNPCFKDNGRCQYLCIYSNDSNRVSSNSYRCACPIGLKLAQDLRSCITADEFLLYSQQNYIRGIVLDRGLLKPSLTYSNQSSSTSQQQLLVGPPTVLSSLSAFSTFSSIEKQTNNSATTITLTSNNSANTTTYTSLIYTGKNNQTLAIVPETNYTYQAFNGSQLVPNQTFSDIITPVESRAARFVGLDFDARKQYIYYSDVILDVIYRIRPNSTGKENILASQNEGVEGLALDWASQNLYYIDSRKGTLNVINLANTTQHRVLLSNLKRPRAIVLHPNRGYLFFSEWDRPANISRAHLDGTNVVVFKGLTLGWPNGLSIDYSTDRLYWVDALLDIVQHSKLDGTDVKQFTTSSIKHPFSLVIYEEWLYLTDWRLDSILKMNKETGASEKVVFTVDEGNRLYGIKIYSLKNQQIRPDHPCANGKSKCNKFCFAVPGNETNSIESTCGCPYGEILAPDLKSCIPDPVNQPPINPCSPSYEFTCANKRCIPKAWVCDNDGFIGPDGKLTLESSDCLDGSDEDPVMCRNKTSHFDDKTQFRCNDGRIIPNSFKCDNDNDCKGGEDEMSCQNVTCDATEFKCNNGRCISKAWRCDGESDCGLGDTSDEDGCDKMLKPCAYYQFRCPDGVCLPMSYKCDRTSECNPHPSDVGNVTFDEAGCIYKPPVCDSSNNETLCRNGRQCGIKCDLVTDCDDASDEEGCPQASKSNTCGPGSWTCRNGVECIAKTEICDGTPQCSDNSDEDPAIHACNPLPPTCSPDQWLCPSPPKLAKDKPKVKFSLDSSATSGKCVPLEKVCEQNATTRTSDCPGSTDEGPACDLVPDKAAQCGALKTYKTPLGPVCQCPDGEKWLNNTCVGLNECEPPGICSQKCEDLKHGFKCSCADGYRLMNKTFCKVQNRTVFVLDDLDLGSADSSAVNDPYLIISNRRSILIANLNATNLERVPIKVENVVATTSDMHAMTLFWSDMQLKKIFKLTKGTSDPQVVIGNGLDLVEGLALDWVGRNLYWVDSRLKTIEVSTMDGDNRVVLINLEKISQPRGLAIDPAPDAKWLFWTDWGESPRIERAGLDGSNRSTIISTKIYWPNGITLDTPNKRIYFADSKLDYIDFCNYDGTGRHQVLANSHYLLHPHSLTVFEDTLYWTDRQLNRVTSTRKFRGGNQTVVSHLVSHPLGIHANHPVLQPKHANPCQINTCDQICLLSPTATFGYTCKCRPGYESKGNECIQTDKPFLMVMKQSQLTDLSISRTSSGQSSKSMNHFIPIVGIDSGFDFDYDKRDEMVYWIKMKDSSNDLKSFFDSISSSSSSFPDDKVVSYGMSFNSSLNRVSLKHGNSSRFIPDGIQGAPYCVAFDWLGRNLYVGTHRVSSILVIKVNSVKNHRRTIIDNDGSANGVARPKAIVLDPANGKLYWIDDGGYGVPKKLARANMDGSNSSVIYDKFGDNNLESLAMDPRGDRLYFSVSGTSNGAIYSIDITGNYDPKLLVSGWQIGRPLGLSVLNSRLFYLDPIQEKIVRLNLEDSEEEIWRSAINLEENASTLSTMKLFDGGRRQRNSDNHVCQQLNGGCSHICVPVDSVSRKCICSAGSKLSPGSDTECSPYKSFAIVASLNRMQGFSLEDHAEAMQPLAGNGRNILHVDVHVAKNSVYWIEFNAGSSSNGIFRMRPDGSERKHIIADGIGASGIRGLCIDWIADNLYFTNQFPHETFIEVSSLDGTNRLVIHKTSTEAPRELAIDPIERYLYWIDAGQFARIWRSNLDGSDRKAVVSTGLYAPKDLVVDLTDHSVYWCDTFADAIMKVDKSGQVQTIWRNLPSVYGLALLGDDLFWVDRNTRMVYKGSKNNRANEQRSSGKGPSPSPVKSDIEKLRDIVLFDIRNQPSGNSPCSSSSPSSKCDQLCFALPSNDKQICECALGHLATDGKTCVQPEEYLLITTRREIRSFSLDKAHGSPFSPYGNLSQVVGLDYDYENKRLMFSQIRPEPLIAIIDIDSTSPERGITGAKPRVIKNKGINPEGIAYDWVSKKIYWADSVNKTIMAMNLDGTQVVEIIRVERPRALVLDPCAGYMYYTDWGRGGSARIFRVTMAGDMKLPIINNTLTQPSGLAIDYQERKLYWSDAGREKIERANLDGSGRETLISATIYPFAMRVHGNHIYWTDLQLHGVYRAEKNTGGNMIEIVKRLDETPRDIHIFTPQKKYCDKTPCEIDNGGCAHSCHPGPEGRAECTCELGFKVANEGKMCVPNNVTICESNRFTCPAGGKCLPRFWLCENTGKSDDDDCGPTPDYALLPSQRGLGGRNISADEDPRFCRVHTCNSNEIRCQKSGRCLPKVYACDHDYDCGIDDKSDEENCTYPPCQEGEFRCDNQRCIPRDKVCDGSNTCHDSRISDESHDICPSNRTCPVNTFKCPGSNMCIVDAYLCDGDADCGLTPNATYSADEDPTMCATRTCPLNTFRCGSGRCLPVQNLCDDDIECPKGEDESPELCASRKNGTKAGCFGDMFQCDDGTCIPRAYLADYDRDCPSGEDEDERHYSRKCDPEREIHCPENRAYKRPVCLPKAYLCDQAWDCVTGLDENATLFNCPQPKPCDNQTQFTCKNGQCIDKRFECDNMDPDCLDHSDEHQNCKYRMCNATTEFTCRSGKCIKLHEKCDQSNDCGDNSDEDLPECKPKPVPDGMFRCGDGKLIRLDQVCDKRIDCTEDLSDESPHCNVNECANPELNLCEHTCVDKPIGFECQCGPGYKLKNQKSCVDIDECAETPNGGCSQICVNHPGTHYCKCDETHYTRELDGRNCKRRDTIAPWLIFSNRYYLRNMSTDGRVYNLIKMDLKNAVALDYDYNEERLYYADVGNKTIHRIFMNGSNEETIVRHDTHGLEGLAVDWVAKKLYWIDRTSKHLDVSELDGRNRKTILAQGIYDPRALAVHPGIGYLFFTDWSNQASISRLGMDGSNLKRLITYEDRLVWPNALTIDYASDKIYWADAHLDRIEFADYDGKNRHVVLSGAQVPHVFAVSVFDNDVYWTDWDKKALLSANKLTGEDIRLIRNTSHRPYDVHVYHPLHQLPYSNPCQVNNGGCSHLCLITPANMTNYRGRGDATASFTPGYKCACPNDFKLDLTNNKTCTADCKPGYHKCGSPDEKCILSLYHKCNGVFDCSDRSDEANCPASTCTPGLYRCQNSTSCLSQARLCDGIRSCPMGDDESSCGDIVCGDNQFKCNKSGGRCIASSWVGDGTPDCEHGEDEDDAHRNQTTFFDEKTQFRCNDGKIIPKAYYCDMDRDCEDESDEPAHLCRLRSCPEGWLRCPASGSYRCIPSYLYCNGRSDCHQPDPDTGIDADESHPEMCPHDPSGFKCKDGKTIPQRHKCDFDRDCSGGEDEDPDMCKGAYRECSESEFQCKQSQKCIPNIWRCDGDGDCATDLFKNDNSDEEGCLEHQCRRDQLKCRSGHCYSAKEHCDGSPSCLDASDESECPPRFPDGKYCRNDQFQCNNTVCVDLTSVCDGDTTDCSPDGSDTSDESPEACQLVASKIDMSNRFRCANGRLVWRHQVCDGINHCYDGSDENNGGPNQTICKPKQQSCSEDQFKCDNKCLALEKLCNHVADCSDQSDERGCLSDGICQPPKQIGKCFHGCLPVSGSNGSYVCTCPPGYRLPEDASRSCEDIDECETKSMNNCSQICTNTLGSFYCSCHPGFQRYDNRCSPEGNTRAFILYTNGPEVRSVDVGEQYQSSLVSGESRIEALDFDPVDQLLYWADSHDNLLKRAKIPDPRDASHGNAFPQQIVTLKDVSPVDLSVDWVTRNLYWIEIDLASQPRPKGKILVSKLDGRYKRQVVSTALERPTSLVVDPESGLMFWTEAGVSPKIERSWMDGTKRKIIVNERLGHPAAITIDYHRLYWCDSKLNTIETSNIDGLDRYTVLQEQHPANIDIFDDRLYWMNRDTNEIYRQDKFGYGVKVLVKRSMEHTHDIKIYHEKKYNTSLPNYCDKSSCSHLCLTIPLGYRCLCPDGSSQPEGGQCYAPLEQSKALPIECKCRNGGTCVETTSGGGISCRCPEDYQGSMCEDYVRRRPVFNNSESVFESVLFVLLIFAGLIFAAGYVFFRKREFKSSQSVLFRNGSNVEFTNAPFGAGFVEHGDILLHDQLSQDSGFTNPTYPHATSTLDSRSTITTKSNDQQVGFPKSPYKSSSATNDVFRTVALNPTSIDTDKDTEMLVEEDKD